MQTSASNDTGAEKDPSWSKSSKDDRKSIKDGRKRNSKDKRALLTDYFDSDGTAAPVVALNNSHSHNSSFKSTSGNHQPLKPLSGSDRDLLANYYSDELDNSSSSRNSNQSMKRIKSRELLEGYFSDEGKLTRVAR